jgi:5-methylcytosine-specific restriction protein A
MLENDPPTKDSFEKVLKALFQQASSRSETSITIRAGDLHALVGGYPGTNNHRMPVCCSVMRSLMTVGDEIVKEPPKKDGANVFIKYLTPRRVV